MLLWVGAGACGLVYRAPAPISAVAYASSDRGADRLLVLLPGRADVPEDFEKQGIVQMAQRAGAPIDVVAVDATLGYYIHNQIAERLEADVVEPARARGCRSIWIAGISIGGFGALLYAERHPEAIAGVLALSPYLGDDDVIDEIERAGGLARWTPPAPIPPGDWQRALWSFLRSCAGRHAPCPRIFVGYGRSDRYVRADRLLSDALLPEQVVVVDGGHNWGPWRQIFAWALPRMLARSEDDAMDGRMCYDRPRP